MNSNQKTENLLKGVIVFAFKTNIGVQRAAPYAAVMFVINKDCTKKDKDLIKGNTAKLANKGVKSAHLPKKDRQESVLIKSSKNLTTTWLRS